MNKKIIIKYLSTFLFCLPFIGYQLVTSIFLRDYATLEDEGTVDSRLVTVPYRAFVLLMSLLLIALNRKELLLKNKSLKLYFLFWGLLLLRIFYDLQYQSEHLVNVGAARQTWLYVLFICLAPTLAVLKSFKHIEFRLAFRIILLGYVILIPVFNISNPLLFSNVSEGRISGNIALNTISFGHWGGALFLLAFVARKQISNYLAKLFFVVMMGVGLFVLLRAGSRGPLIAVVACFLFYYASRQKNPVLAIIVMVGLLFAIYISGDYIFVLIRNISPTLANRLVLSSDVANSYEVYSNGRAALYTIAINNIINNPFLGKSFAVFNETGSYIYSHNVILDAFMALGLLGGFLFVLILIRALVVSWYLIRMKSSHLWIGLLAVQQIVAHMFSGAFYQSDILNVLLVTLFAFSIPSQKKYILKK